MDAPDWIPSGRAIQYLDTFGATPGNQVTKTYTVPPWAQSLVIQPHDLNLQHGVAVSVICPAIITGGGVSGPSVTTLFKLLQPALHALLRPEPVAAYVNSGLSQQWQVSIQVPAGGTTASIDVWASAAPAGNTYQPQIALPQRPYDQQLVASPASGTLASIAFPATPSCRWVVGFVTATLNASLVATNAVIKDFRVREVGGSLFWFTRLVIPPCTTTTAVLDRVTLSGLSIIGTENTAMTIDFDTSPPASVYQSISAGAWLV